MLFGQPALAVLRDLHARLRLRFFHLRRCARLARRFLRVLGDRQLRRARSPRRRRGR